MNPASGVRVEHQPRALLGLAVLLVFLSFVLVLRAWSTPVNYNEAVTLLELSGQEKYLWPNQPSGPEAYLRSLEQHRGPFAVVNAVLQSDTHPPLYYVAAWAWQRLFGNSIFSLRSLSILCFLLSAVFFCLSRPAKSRLLEASIYLLILAAGTEVISARNYCLALLVLSVHEWLLLRAKSALLAGYAGGLAFSVHYLAILIVLPSRLFRIQHRESKTSLLRYTLGLCVGGSAGIVFFLFQRGMRPEQYSGFPGFGAEALATLDSLSRVLFPFPKIDDSLIVIFDFAILLGLCLSAQRAFGRTEKVLHPDARSLSQRALFAIACYCAGLLLVSFIFQKGVISQGPPRYFLLLAFPLITAFATFLGNDGCRSKTTRMISAFAIAGLCLPFAFRCFTLSGDSFSAARERFSAACRSSSLIVIGGGYGRGFPGALFHLANDLRCKTPMIVLSKSNFSVVNELSSQRAPTLLLRSEELPTSALEQRLYRSQKDRQLMQISSWSLFEP